MKAEVKVELKEGIFDPEGENIKKALNLLGFSGVRDVKLTRLYTIEIDGDDNVEDMCTTLLTNPVIHKYTIRRDSMETHLLTPNAEKLKEIGEVAGIG